MSSAGDIASLPAGSPSHPVKFGKFYLLGLIARGGMAEVYRARLATPDDGPEQPGLLAIKVMRRELASEPRFAAMFRREGQLATLLESRSIVRAFEHGVFEDRPYIAMEYIPGRDLNQVLRRCQEQKQRLPIPHAIYIAARIAEGLSAAHNLRDRDQRPLNLVNRDVSPSNVRVSYDGEVKLLDFGIAQALMAFTSEIGVLKGKFSYMSPEQIRGMPLDARSDIFSCGIILHEMLTTQKLFRGESEFALMERVRSAEVEPPSRHNKRVGPELDRVVLRALARDVAERYQSAAELRADLENALAAYQFEPSELQEFLRRLFRAEWMREQDNAAQVLYAMEGAEAETEPGRVPSDFDTAEHRPPTGVSGTHTGSTPSLADPGDAEDDEPRTGFWARLRRWRR